MHLVGVLEKAAVSACVMSNSHKNAIMTTKVSIQKTTRCQGKFSHRTVTITVLLNKINISIYTMFLNLCVYQVVWSYCSINWLLRTRFYLSSCNSSTQVSFSSWMIRRTLSNLVTRLSTSIIWSTRVIAGKQSSKGGKTSIPDTP